MHIIIGALAGALLMLVIIVDDMNDRITTLEKGIDAAIARTVMQ